MFMINPEEKVTALEVMKEWQERTGFELEEDNIKRYMSKDVNNYFTEFTNGKVKAKGGYIGRYKGGSFDKNSMIIVQKAIVNYLAEGITPDVTIDECDDIRLYQIISKMGGSYSKCFHEVNGHQEDIQKVNRVYASKDTRYGTIKKFKIEKGKERYDSVAGLPEHCIIDNSNELTINDIDKQWYIDIAIDRTVDFLVGVTKRKKMSYEEKINLIYGGKNMATAKKVETKPEMNIHQKLAMARMDFIKRNVKKTGKNSHFKQMYYTLDDIVPAATEILSGYGLLAMLNIETEKIVDSNTGMLHETRECKATVTDGVNSIHFTAPFVMQKPILSKEGNEVTNPVQSLGSSITYMRRYMWFIIMDIVEHDWLEGDESEFEAPTETASSEKAKEPVKPKKTATRKTTKKPLNNEEKKEAVKEVVNNNEEMMNNITFNAIKKGLSALKDVDPIPEEFMKAVIDELNDAEGKITMKRANEILAQMQDLMEGE